MAVAVAVLPFDRPERHHARLPDAADLDPRVVGQPHGPEQSGIVGIESRLGDNGGLARAEGGEGDSGHIGLDGCWQLHG